MLEVPFQYKQLTTDDAYYSHVIYILTVGSPFCDNIYIYSSALLILISFAAFTAVTIVLYV